MLKTLIKESEDDSNKWKDIPWSQTERITVVKMAIVPPPKIPTDLMQQVSKDLWQGILAVSQQVKNPIAQLAAEALVGSQSSQVD